jgi:hypothetical protein
VLSAGVGAAAEELLEQLGLILKAKPRGEQLLQVLLCEPQAGPRVGAALSAMLSSASQENPKLKGQVLLLEGAQDAQRLWQSLERNAGSGELLVREKGAQREVWGYRLFAEGEVERGTGAAPWRAGGVYLIRGGAGGLGLIFAEQIVRTARDVRLILTGRSLLGEERAGQLERLREMGLGCVLEYEQLDVSDRTAVEACVRGIEERHGALHGVLHSAGVIRDSFIINKSAAQLH